MAINKRFAEEPVRTRFNGAVDSVLPYRYSAADPGRIERMTPLPVADGVLTATLPAQSITLLEVDTATDDDGPVRPQPGRLHPPRYGPRWGDIERRDAVEFVSDAGAAGRDWLLEFDAYDLDADSELEIRLNSERLAFAPRGRNNRLTTHALQIPAARLRAGDNRLDFRQQTSGWVRGVTQILPEAL